MSKQAYRDLNNYEKEVIGKLLENPFPGRDEIRKQIQRSKVRTIEEYKDNYGSIEFVVQTDLKVPVLQRVPVVGRAYDVDKVPIEMLLHVVDGKVRELEFVKADGSPIKTFPSVEEFVIIVRF